MSKCVDCTNCKMLVDLNGDPILCHICPKDHILCERCNDIARGYCLCCGGKTARMQPGTALNDIFKAPAEMFMKRLADSCSLVVSQEEGCAAGGLAAAAEATVIGFKKWPRTFFHKIPNESASSLAHNEKLFLELLPNIIEYESSSSSAAAPVVSGGGGASKTSASWTEFPKDYAQFELSCEIMRCPITKCAYPLCNSDATRHLLQSHEYLPIEVIARFAMGQFTVNTLSLRQNENIAVTRILVPGVVRGLGTTKYKDYLPLYLLCTRINILEAEQRLLEEEEEGEDGVSKTNTLDTLQFLDTAEVDNDLDYAACNPWKSTDCMLIWCAGIVPLDYTIRIGISVYPQGDVITNLGAIVKVLSLHAPQSGHAIYKSTNRLMITAADVCSFANRKNAFSGQMRIM